MSSAPFFSVITPTYNHEAFIAECIESVLEQTYASWELVIIDDGSTDRTWEIVQSYTTSDSRIRAFRQPNRGPKQLAETYNAALAQARGQFIAILEGDDYWFPKKLATQLEHLSDSTVMLYSSYKDEVDGHLRLGRQPPFKGRISLQAFLPIVLLHQSFVLAVTQVIRHDALLEIGGFHQDGSPAAVDFATLLRLLRLPGDVVYLNEPLGVWRHHGNQATSLRAIELASFNAQLATKFCDHMLETGQASLGFSREAVAQARRQQVADAYFGVLRTKLHRRETESVSALVVGLWRYGNIKQKLEAVYAYVAMRIGWDFEVVLRYISRIQTVLGSLFKSSQQHKGPLR